MQFESFVTFPALQVFRYSDIDHFRQALRLVQVDMVPLNMANFAPAQAVLTLPGCDVCLLWTFPRILDATLTQGNVLILFAMEDAAAPTFNGIEVDFPTLAFMRGKAGYKIVEPAARLSAAISFSSPMRDRGWPDVEDGIRSCPLPAHALAALRALTRKLFAFASLSPESFLAAEAAMGVKESLLAALDDALLSSMPLVLERNASYRKHMRIAETIDAVLHANPAAPIYSEALAGMIGVSVRTLHNVIVRMRGVSLHQYLRMKRLWMVRQRLLTGNPSLQVSSCALAFGFWHMGEFSAAYAALFGEVPSRTLARGRARAA